MSTSILGNPKFHTYPNLQLATPPCVNRVPCLSWASAPSHELLTALHNWTSFTIGWWAGDLTRVTLCFFLHNRWVTYLNHLPHNGWVTYPSHPFTSTVFPLYDRRATYPSHHSRSFTERWAPSPTPTLDNWNMCDVTVYAYPIVGSLRLATCSTLRTFPLSPYAPHSHCLLNAWAWISSNCSTPLFTYMDGRASQAAQADSSTICEMPHHMLVHLVYC